MQYETLLVTVDDRGVASLELNAPEKRNALSEQMLSELTHFATTVGERQDVRVVVLSGRGKMFCAGGDLAWMQAQMTADRAARMASARHLARMLRAMNQMPRPLIAKVHGGAFGGGVGLACVCDTVIAEEPAKFGLTETKLGLIPATIGPYVIARMGEGNARQIIMSSRILGAAEAVWLGMVSTVAAVGTLDTAIEAEVEPYLNVAPKAVAAAKALTLANSAQITDAMVEDSIQRLADVWEGDEAAEGIGAFLEKRRPNWQQSSG